MKYIFLVTIFLSSLCSINAQYKESDLQGHVWKAIKGYFAESVADCYMTFSKSKVVIDTKEKDSDVMMRKTICNVYLSDQRTKDFDSTLVGKDSEGKFIVMGKERVYKGKMVTETSVAEILSIDDSTLLLKFAPNADTTILKAQKLY